MVSKAKIKALDFETIEEYFDYIAESIVNGQIQQAKTLVNDLSKKQLKEAFNYYNNDFSSFFGDAKQLITNRLFN